MLILRQSPHDSLGGHHTRLNSESGAQGSLVTSGGARSKLPTLVKELVYSSEVTLRPHPPRGSTCSDCPRKCTLKDLLPRGTRLRSCLRSVCSRIRLLELLPELFGLRSARRPRATDQRLPLAPSFLQLCGTRLCSCVLPLQLPPFILNLIQSERQHRIVGELQSTRIVEHGPYLLAEEAAELQWYRLCRSASWARLISRFLG